MNFQMGGGSAGPSVAARSPLIRGRASATCDGSHLCRELPGGARRFHFSVLCSPQIPPFAHKLRSTCLLSRRGAVHSPPSPTTFPFFQLFIYFSKRRGVFSFLFIISFYFPSSFCVRRINISICINIPVPGIWILRAPSPLSYLHFRSPLLHFPNVTLSRLLRLRFSIKGGFFFYKYSSFILFERV